MPGAYKVWIYREASYFAKFVREDFEGNTSSKSRVLFADEKTAKLLDNFIG